MGVYAYPFFTLFIPQHNRCPEEPFGLGLQDLRVDGGGVVFRVMIETGAGCPIIHAGIACLHEDCAIRAGTGEVTVLPLHQLAMDVFVVRRGGHLCQLRIFIVVARHDTLARAYLLQVDHRLHLLLREDRVLRVVGAAGQAGLLAINAEEQHAALRLDGRFRHRLRHT